MNAPIKLAQAESKPGTKEVKVVKLTKPADNQAVTIELSYDQSIKVDFSEIANEKIIIVRVGERAVILFDNGATVTLDPFFDSLRRPLANLEFEIAPGKVLTAIELAGLVPFTDDQSILPAAGEGDPREAGANFGDPNVEAIGPVVLNELLPEEFLFPPEFNANIAPALVFPPLLFAGLVGIVEEEHLRDGVESPFGHPILSEGNEDETAGNSGEPDEDEDVDPDFDNTTHQFKGQLVITGGSGNYVFSLVPGWTPATPILSKGDTLSYFISGNVLTAYAESGANPGFNLGEDRVVFTLEVTATGEVIFTLNDQLDHPLVNFEDILDLDFSGLIRVDDPTAGLTLILDGVVIGVIDDVPVLTDHKEVKVVSENDIDTPLSLGTSPNDGNADGSYTGDPGNNDPGPAFVSGTLINTVSPGSDEGGKFTFDESLIDAKFGALGLKSKGVALTYEVDDTDPDFQIFRAIASDANGDRVVFELKLFSATGNYEFRLYDQLDHDPPNDITVDGVSDFPGSDQNFDLQDDITGDVTSLGFGDIIKYTDFDGDWVVLENKLEIFIRDDVPKLIHGEKIVLIVDEDDIKNAQSRGTSPNDGDGDGSLTGNPPSNVFGPAFVSGSLNGVVVQSGADEDLTFSFINGATTLLGLLGLKSKGQTISYQVQGENLFAFVEGGGGGGYQSGSDRLVFKFTLLANGDFEFELHDQLDHDPPNDFIIDGVSLFPGADENFDLQDGLFFFDVDSLDFGSLIQAVDHDGDRVILHDKLIIKIRDDVPELKTNKTVFGVVEEEHLPQGNEDTTSGPPDLDNDTIFNPNITTNVTSGSGGNSLASLVEVGADEDGKFAFKSGLSGTNIKTTGGQNVTSNYVQVTIKNVVAGSDGGGAFQLLTAWNGTNDIFTLKVYADGDWVFTLLDQVDHHPFNSADNAEGFLSLDLSGLLQFTDFDGDTIHLDGANFFVKVIDDVPTLKNLKTTHKSVQHDETPGVQGGSDDDVLFSSLPAPIQALFNGVILPGSDPDVSPKDNGAIGYASSGGSIVSFNASVGADQPGTVELALVLSSQGTFSGLQTTDGRNIYLFKEGDVIVGRYDKPGDFDTDVNPPPHPDADPAAFAIAIGNDGTIYLVQWVSLKHPIGGSSHDESISIASGKVKVEVTVTDQDGDKATGTVDISGKIKFDDDGPKITSVTTSGTLIHDETSGNDGPNDSNTNFSALFASVTNKGNDPHVNNAFEPAIGYAQTSGSIVFVNANFGSDGPHPTQDVKYALSIGNQNTSLRTTEGQIIKLFLENGIIVGRYDANNSNFVHPSEPAAFAIHINSDTGVITLVQYVSLLHPIQGDSHDEPVFLAANNVRVTVTVKDGDGDTDSESVNIGHLISFEDDGPSVTVGVSTQFNPITHLALALDETVQPDGATNPSYDRYNGAETESPPPPSNGGADDVDPLPINQVYNRDPVYLTNPLADQAIGSRTTPSGAIGNLFLVGAPNFGADGPGPNGGVSQTLKLILSGVDQEGYSQTNLRVTEVAASVVDGLDPSERSIYLFQLSDTVIEGRLHSDVSVNPTGTPYVAFRITLNNANDPANASITVDQFMAIDHGGEEGPSIFDENVVLSLIQGGTLDLMLEVTVTDGDLDTATSSATVNLAYGSGSFVSFDDDGPVVLGVSATSVILDDEDTSLNGIGIQGGPGDDGSGLTATGQILFDPGTDGLKSIVVNGIDGLQAIYVDANGIGTPYGVNQNWVAGENAGGGTTGFEYGGTLVGTMNTPDGAIDVFTLEVDNDGNYTFTLIAPLAHPYQDSDSANDGPETSWEDNLLLNFVFTITDGDEDTVTGTLTFNVDDDSPTIAAVSICEPDEPTDHFPTRDISYIILYFDTDNDDLPEFTVGIEGFDFFGDSFDLDNLLDGILDYLIAQNIIDASYELLGLSVKQALTHTFYDLDNDPNDVDVPPFPLVEMPNADVKDIQLNTIFPNGLPTAGGNGDHCDPILVHDETQGVQNTDDPNGQNDAAGNTLPSAILALFNEIVDANIHGSDGDVPVKDNNAIGFARSGIGQNGLGNSGVVLNVQFGADGAHADNALAFALQIPSEGVLSGVQTTEGVDIYLYTGSGDLEGLILGRVGGANGDVAFALTIDPATGELFVAQYLSIFNDKPGDGSGDTHDEIMKLADGAVQVIVTAKDGDGDAVTSDPVNIGKLIGFNDDGPVALNDTDSVGILSATDGNVITGAGTTSGLAGADSTGSDGATVTQFTHNVLGGPGGPGDVIVGQFGTLTFAADGSYTYTRTANSAGVDVFTYTLTDGDGDTSTATLTITLDAQTTPLSVSGTVSGTVEEEHLDPSLLPTGLGYPITAEGIDDETSDTSPTDLDDDAGGNLNLTTHQITGTFTSTLTIIGVDGTLSFSIADVVTGTPVQKIGGGDLTSGGQQVLFHKISDTQLVGYVDDGNAGFDENDDLVVFSLEIKDQTTGEYEFTLYENVDHHPINAADNEEDAIAIDLGGRVLISDIGDAGDTAAIDNFSVNVIDDVPVAVDDSAEAQAGAKPTLNAVFVIDLSLSMGSFSGDPLPGDPAINTRLQLLQAAVVNLLSNTDVEFKDILIYTFGTEAATTFRLRTDDAGQAILEINGYGESDLSGGTNYNAAANTVMTHFAGLGTPLADADQTVLYFLTDGDPTPPFGVPLADPAAWEAFLNTYINKVFAVGFSDVSDDTFLSQMAPRVDDEAKIVLDPAALEAELEGTLPSPAAGNVLDNDPGFGADGGYIKSIVVDGVTYTFDGVGSIAESAAPPAGYEDHGTWILVPTVLGGTFTFYFADTGANDAGDWTYTPPAALPGGGEENLQYTLIDGDGDTASANLNIEVLEGTPPNQPPVANNDIVLTNIVGGGPIVIPNAALLNNDSDPDNDPLDVTNVENGVGGNVALGSAIFTPTLAAPVVTETVYNFVGKTAGTGPHLARYFEVDIGTGNGQLASMTLNGTGSAGFANTTELTTAQYGQIASSDNVSYSTPDPSPPPGGDNAVFWAQFDIAEKSDTITRIDIRIEARQDSGAGEGEGAELGIWNYATGSWVSLTEIAATADTNYTAAITVNPQDYVSLDGKVTVVLYNQDDNSSGGTNQRLHVDYAEVKITSSAPPPFANGEFDYTASDGQDDDTAHVTISGVNGKTINGTNANEVLIGRDTRVVNADIRSGSIGNSGNNQFGFAFVAAAAAADFIKQIVIDITSLPNSAIFDLAGDGSLAFTPGSESDITMADVQSVSLADTTKLVITFIDGAFSAGEVLRFGVDVDPNNGYVDNPIGFGAEGVPFAVTFGDGVTLAGAYQPGPGNTAVGTVGSDEGDDILNGAGGDDFLAGGGGNDVLTGGDGADTFYFAHAGTEHMDTITDYDFAEGDKVDLSGLLDGIFDANTDNIANFVRITDTGADALVQVDVTGTASFDPAGNVAVLTGYGDTSNTVRIVLDNLEHNVNVV